MKKQIWEITIDKEKGVKLLSCNHANIIFDEIKETDIHYEIRHNESFSGHLFKPQNEIREYPVG